MKLRDFLVFLWLIAAAASLNASQESEPSFDTVERQARRSKFSTTCQTIEGYSGTCMSRFACTRQGGYMKGYCGGGYGICCENNLEAGDESKLKRTVIRNPQSMPLERMEYSIAPYSTAVCQLRIDFEHLDLPDPQETGTDEEIECADYLEVGRFKICGSNTNQHLYLPFNGANSASRIQLIFVLPSRWAEARWSLIVTQLECPVAKSTPNTIFSSIAGQANIKDLRTVFKIQHGNTDLDLLAPAGCDQYHTASSGSIKSFNYGSLYVPDMSYAICIKSPMAPSMITYTVSKGYPFSLATSGGNFDDSCQSTVTMNNRPSDYITIPQSTASVGAIPLQPYHYCGDLSEGFKIQAVPPFIVYSTSDRMKRESDPETGFYLDYVIKPVYTRG